MVMSHNPPSREQQAYEQIMAENARSFSQVETEEYRKEGVRQTLANRIHRKLPRVF